MTATALERVEQVLDEKVRPLLGLHGGGVSLIGLTADGVLSVEFHGECVGCPAADVSLRYLVKDELMTALPDVVRDVVLIGGVSDDLIALARRLMVRSRAKQNRPVACCAAGPSLRVPPSTPLASATVGGDA